MVDSMQIFSLRQPIPVRAALVATAAFILANAAAAAEVYRSVDAAGNVSYSDRPVGENSETVYIATPRPSSTPPPAPPATDSTAAATTSASAAPPAEPEPTPEELAEERAANCSAARDRLERYLMSRRLYRMTDDGEREYLSDAEIDAARAGAAGDVEQWCD